MRYSMAIDIGTTNLKLGVFNGSEELGVYKIPATAYKISYIDAYDASRIWAALCETIREIPHEVRKHITYIGITGMAEPGVLVHSESGEIKSYVKPWYDAGSYVAYNDVKKVIDQRKRYSITGLPNHSKYGCYKLLELADETDNFTNLYWMSLPEFIAWKFTGKRATDITLAARTYLYDIIQNRWDTDFMRELNLPRELFPDVYPSGHAMGNVLPKYADLLPGGASVAVCGHDHFMAAYAADALNASSCFISTGTAQVLLGVKNENIITESDLDTGFSFGAHPASDQLTWMGSIQSAGGSVNFMKENFYNSYDEFFTAAKTSRGKPSGILYFPYLSGSGAPNINPSAKAAFLNISALHTRGDVAASVLEGIAYETRLILEAAKTQSISIKISGGLVSGGIYPQILANVLNAEICALNYREATLLGAALLASGNKGEGEKYRVFYPDKNRIRWNECYNEYRRMHSAIYGAVDRNMSMC